MNKLVATLATTTVLFAGSTFYFWLQLRERDSAGTAVQSVDAQAPMSGTAAAPKTVPVASASTAGKAVTATPATTGAGAASAASPAGKSAGRDDPSREMMLPFAKDFLRQYDNPAQRASLMNAARTGVESQYSRIKERLKLDAGTFGQLVDLLAEEQLEQQANYFRCLVDPDCDTSKIGPARDHSNEFLALLGADGYAQLSAYRSAIPEWQSVVQLRGRLSESNSLNDSGAERLMSALTAERERYMAEASQAGAKTRGWGNGTGMLWYSGDGGAEEQFASAMQYSERVRQRAAGILTAEQLRAFVQLQEEMLAGLASYLHTQSGKQG